MLIENRYSCAIVDDEQYAIDLLKSRLNILNKNIAITASYSSWQSALEGLRTESYDLLFLDISMKGYNGMELLNYLPGLKSEVIFVTAHAEYAINAFKFFATGYLLKPINDLELVYSINKAIERLEAKKNKPHAISKIGVPHLKSVIYINSNDIVYLEAENTYTRLVLVGKELVCSYNIGKYKDVLPDITFFQVHRSYIVNTSYVDKYDGSGIITMSNGKEIPLSKKVREEFLGLFGKVITNFQSPKG